MTKRLRTLMLVALIGSTTIFAPPKVSALENCTEEKMRGVGAIVTLCEPPDECSVSQAAPTAAGSATGKKIFYIGDSLTVGATFSGRLLEKSVENGFSATTAFGATEGVGDSHSVAGEVYPVDGERPSIPYVIRTSGKSVEARGGWDAEQVGELLAEHPADLTPSNVDVFVISLGTNMGGGRSTPYEEQIDNLMTQIRNANPSAKVLWVNAFHHDPKPAYDWASQNAIIASVAATRNDFQIIDYATAAQADPSIAPPNTGSDRIHVYNNGSENKLDKKVDWLISNVKTMVESGGNSQPNTSVNPDCTCQAGPTGVSAPAASGTYSAIVWGNEKTLPIEWIPILNNAGRRFDVDPAILSALMSVETAWDTPASFATNPRRNGASATGPFQFIDVTATSYMPAPDPHTAITDPSKYTSSVIKGLNGGSEKEPDGSYVVDGNKDGKVDRATPEDAALMAAAYMKSLGVGLDTPLGDRTDYKVPKKADANPLTVRLAGAYYNQGGGWSAPDATTPEQLNSKAKGANDVAHYIDQMWDVTNAGREAGVFDVNYTNVSTCGLQAGESGYDLPNEGPNPMVFYSQNRTGSDPAVQGYFGDAPYDDPDGSPPPGVIANCGCGPTSWAMIVSTLTGNTVEPPEVATWAQQNGFQQPPDTNPKTGEIYPCGGSGWWWSGSPAVSEEHWGVRATRLETVDGDPDPDAAATALRNGALIIVSASENQTGNNSPFTNGGHLLVMRAVTDDGKFLFADPNSDEHVGDSNKDSEFYNEAYRTLIGEPHKKSRTPLEASQFIPSVAGMWAITPIQEVSQ